MIAQVLAHFPLTSPTWKRIPTGLINETYEVKDGEGRYVLQKVNPIFPPEIHHNIELVTRHVKEVILPKLVTSKEGKSWLKLGDEGVWRLMTAVPGKNLNRLQNTEQAFSLGKLVGSFHSELQNLPGSLVAYRPMVHEPKRHLESLEKALQEHSDHRLYDQVRPLAQEVLAAASGLPALPACPNRPAHGDLKVNNAVFDRNQAIGLIDLDTLGPMPLYFELADAFRSWCNPHDEDAGKVEFSLPFFEAAVQGYASCRKFDLTDNEKEGMGPAMEWIPLELAARFAADALNESYFGWDRSKYESAGEHHLIRARNQFALHQKVVSVRRQRLGILSRL